MKKLVTVFALAGLVFFASQNVQAQTEGIELGLRFANAENVAIDFAMPLGSNRLHANAAFYSGGVGVGALYDWQFPFAEGFVFYPGLGAAVALSDSFGLAVGGEVGVEYQFPFPLTLGVDYQPMFSLINGSGYADGWGFNARWRF